jgi:hypothetical protein
VIIRHTAVIAASFTALWLASAHAQTTTEQTPAGSVVADFATHVLAGGAINTVTITVPMDRITEQLHATFEWSSARRDNQLFSCERANLTDRTEGLTTAESTKNVPNGDGKRTVTVVTLYVPSPHCSWPPWQQAKVTLSANVRQAGGPAATSQMLLSSTQQVSVFWFPFAAALAVVTAIYPGCAAISWLVRRRRLERAAGTVRPGELPGFWSSLDPVQITANSYGRASLAKLQIFGFSLLVFGLMLYYQLRMGVLITLSTDVLALLGISAIGATGGKLTQITKRRLSFANWAWLRRNGSLPHATDASSPRARWSELVTDYDGREFDVYAFQMAIFSLTVAIALITTNFAGLEAFHIPPELLGLLGISQGVFIVGRAAGTTAYQELDQALTAVRAKSAEYFAARAAGPEKQKEADAALAGFREAAQQAAQMFWDVYGEQIGADRPPAALAPGALATITPDAPATR